MAAALHSRGRRVERCVVGVTEAHQGSRGATRGSVGSVWRQWLVGVLVVGAKTVVERGMVMLVTA